MLWLCAGGLASAADVPVDIGPSRITAGVTSYRARRDASVVKQQRDYSCGAAAFATLLNFGFGDPIREDEILDSVFANADEKAQRIIENKGLSLLDLKTLAEARGYRAHAFRIRADQLRQISRPVIVFIRPHGYEHFAVLKGVRGDRVYLADPSQGNWRVPMFRFLDMWSGEDGRGVLFAVERPDGTWLDSMALVAPADAGTAAVEVQGVRGLLETGRTAQPGETGRTR